MGREEGDHARRPAPAPQGLEYPSREFAPADPTTRTTNEALQVSAAGTAVPFRPPPDQTPLPPPPRPPHRRSVSRRPGPGLSDLGRGHWCGRCGVAVRMLRSRVSPRPQPHKLTMPFREPWTVYSVQPRTLRIMDQRGGSVCLTSPSIQYR